MRRRKFIRYAALGSTSFLVHLDSLTYQQTDIALSTTMSNKPKYDWVFLYWMPYDNDLTRFGQPIIQMLSRGVQKNNILVLVESDFSEATKLSRSTIRKDKIDVQYLETADSSSEEVFAEYLNWARSQFQSKRWVIVFLGHGGRLLEISPDDNPESGSSETKWMNLQKLSDILTKFNHAVDNRVELLFFQNCNKGNIEVHYTFRDAAKYTLSSQLTLGAPNYYYESLLQYLANHPDIDGGQLAEKIMEFERKDMYHSLTATNNRYLHQLPAQINPLIDSILASDTKAAQIFINSILPSKTRDNRQNSSVKVYNYSGEIFVDIVEFFQEVAKQSSSVTEKFYDFVDFLNNSLIHRVQKNGELFNPKTQARYQNYCGLGLFLPTSRLELEEYSSLPIYSDLKLIDLFDAILLN